MRPVSFRGQDGFTLVELMVAMSIFLLILVGIFQVFDPSRNAYQVSTRKLDVQQNARVAMDRMARQIRMYQRRWDGQALLGPDADRLCGDRLQHGHRAHDD